jgi:hypothetical protein
MRGTPTQKANPVLGLAFEVTTLKMVKAARIAWATILIKSRQLILFDGAGFGISCACAKWR